MAGAVAVCRGLSCELHGAAGLAARLGASRPALPVYCLGQCDRSPAIAVPDGSVLAGADALAWPAGGAAIPVPGEIRALSRRAIVTERIGRGSYAALDAARQAGVYAALASALARAPADLLDLVQASGEQGRGGAGFPTGDKWRACARAPGPHRYAVANGDEGDPGSFVDRVLLEDDPHAVLEGLLLCGYAIGAGEGVVFIRAEYPLAAQRVEAAIAEAREAGLIGSAVMGSAFGFEVRVVRGRGSYVCGEETALLNAIEGRRGETRVRPPFPATSGLFGRPTVVNNIETLVNIPWIVREGPDAFRRLGTPTSPGTKAFCLNRGFARPGLVEAEFGCTLRDLVEGAGQGSRDGSPLRAVALGGPMGSVVAPGDFDLAVDSAGLAARGIRLGHGGLVAIPASADLGEVLKGWVAFMAEESCGGCMPCAIGSRRAERMVADLVEGAGSPSHVEGKLLELLALMESTSLCGFGQGIPGALRDILRLLRSSRDAGRASAHE